jgi:FkbM family methyltransferase
MTEYARSPHLRDSLRTLVDLGVEVASVLDVGVFEHTRVLMELFADVRHHLFEPVEDFLPKIRENYGGLEFELHHVALSDSDGEGILVLRSNSGTTKITHAHLSDRPVDRSVDPRVIRCCPVRKARLDSLVPSLDAPAPHLLKIDVDGHELEILRGATQTLRRSSLVVVEAPLGPREKPRLMERASFLLDHGFYLFDIVGHGYYARLLHQVDLVFVRGDIVDASDALRPRETQPIDPKRWFG